MDKRQLEYFLAVVQHENVSRAASYLHVSQPTVSVAIRGLEKEVGGALFERTPTGLIVTPAGQALIEPARRTVRDFEVALECTRDALGLAGGHLHIGTVPAVQAGWLTDVLAQFREAYPEVAIRVVADADDRVIAEGVRTGQFNLGLTVSESAVSGLSRSRVGTQQVAALLPPGSEKGGEAIDIDVLATMDLITMPREKSTARRWFEQVLQTRSTRPRTCIETSSIDGLLPLVTAGAGYALWWTPMAAAMVGQCVLRPIEPRLERPIYLVFRNGPHPPSTRAFMDVAGAARALD